eukprot:403372213
MQIAQRQRSNISPQRNSNNNLTFQASISSQSNNHKSITQNRNSQDKSNYSSPKTYNNTNRISSSSASQQSPLSKNQLQQQAQQIQQDNNLKSKLPKTRPQEAFYKRINEIEKRAKALDQEKEESVDQYDLNDFFKDLKLDLGASGTIDRAAFQRQVSQFMQNNENSISSHDSKNQQQTQSIPGIGKLPILPREIIEQNFDSEFQYISGLLKGNDLGAGMNDSYEDQTHLFTNNNNVTMNEKRNGQNYPSSQVAVYFSPDCALNDDVLKYYGINRNVKDTMIMEGGVNKSVRGLINKNNQFKAIIDDHFERLDSRGKRIKIRRVHVQQEVLGEIGYPFSTINFHPLTYITQHELKARANSLAYSKYKLIKRENAKKAAKRKLLLIMCIVKCKSFVNKLKARVELRRAEKKRMEEEQRMKEKRRKLIKDQQRLLDRSSIDETISSKAEQISGLLNSESQGSLLRFGGANTLNSSSNFGILKGDTKRTESVNFSKKQSPISLPDSRQTSWNYNLGYEINYKTIANGTLEYTLSQLLMNLDTTTIAGSMLFNDIDGNSKLFKLKNMSFHAPSEHTLNGKYYDAELQIVHQAYDSNEMAIISVLFDSQKDISSCLYEKLAVNTFNRINATNATKTSTNQNTTAQRKIVSSNPLKDYVERMGKSFYYYQGSLSIPPCTDSAHWIVMSEVQYITLEQRDALNKLWRSNPTFANGRGNNRLVQELNDRPIYYRHVSLEEHFESLTNHFMLPEGALINGGSSVILALISILYLIQ